jgi:hypothetical protein
MAMCVQKMWARFSYVRAGMQASLRYTLSRGLWSMAAHLDLGPEDGHVELNLNSISRLQSNTAMNK